MGRADGDSDSAESAVEGTATERDETLPSGEQPPPGPLAATVYAGDPKAVARELAPGATLGRYRVGEQLGGGTMGVVLAQKHPGRSR